MPGKSNPSYHMDQTNHANRTSQTDEINPKTVLVAVNDVFFYTKIRDALLPRGYKLVRVRTPDEVPSKLSASHPRAMIINLNDPSLDAVATLETVRHGVGAQPMPILAFANHEEVETWKRATALGVTKIVSRNEFSARTRDLIEDVIRKQPRGE